MNVCDDDDGGSGRRSVEENGGGIGAAAAAAALRARRRELVHLEFGACDCTSYCYFALAVVLFTVGIIVTVLALDEDTSSPFANLGHMWLVGPIFISSGLMVAVKTVLYLRKKNLITLFMRQRALFRELQGLQAQHHQLARNPSILTLPPAYDIVVAQPESCRQTSEAFEERSRSGLSTSAFQEEPPPPTYEEAMLLGMHNLSIVVPANLISGMGNTKASEA